MKKVLVAEDDKAIIEVVKIILENEGYQVFATDNEEQIHRIAQEEGPHIVLLDIWLSGLDGGKIAKDLKAHHKTKHIPIIMLSANNETERVSKEVGADGFLMKPFDIDELLQVVARHTSKDK